MASPLDERERCVLDIAFHGGRPRAITALLAAAGRCTRGSLPVVAHRLPKLPPTSGTDSLIARCPLQWHRMTSAACSTYYGIEQQFPRQRPTACGLDRHGSFLRI